jgi:CheY-like chemotaxis protein
MIMSTKEGPERSLAGLCILIVEDEMMVAMLLEDMLTELGCDVVKAARLAKAFHLIATAVIDCAILDISVAGESVYPLANELRRRGIPFIFSSGYGAGGLAPEYRDHPTLSKPFQQDELAPMLAGAIQRRHH